MIEKGLRRAFAGRRYSSAREVLEDVARISSDVQPIKPRFASKPRLSALDKRVLKLAPEFFRERNYDNVNLARAILCNRRPLYGPAFRLFVKRVADASWKLRKQGRLPASSKFPSKLREVSEREVDKHMALVNHVVDKGYAFFRRGSWQRHMPRWEAVLFARQGLRRALETLDPNKGDIRVHGLYLAASALRNEVRQREKKLRRKRVSPGRPRYRTPREKLRSVTGEYSIAGEDRLKRLSELKSSLQLFLRHSPAQPHHIGIFALRMAGHSAEELARHFKVTKYAVNYVFNQALQLLKGRETS